MGPLRPARKDLDGAAGMAAARMAEMQKTLDLLNHKIEVYENALLKKGNKD